MGINYKEVAENAIFALQNAVERGSETYPETRQEMDLAIQRSLYQSCLDNSLSEHDDIKAEQAGEEFSDLCRKMKFKYT